MKGSSHVDGGGRISALNWNIFGGLEIIFWGNRLHDTSSRSPLGIGFSFIELAILEGNIFTTRLVNWGLGGGSLE